MCMCYTGGHCTTVKERYSGIVANTCGNLPSTRARNAGSALQTSMKDCTARTASFKNEAVAIITNVLSTSGL